ncbi:FeoB-associated Cys-rich membrane protein [Flavobacteriaceae bacterium]|nr:FeoB-associated Cys-rich membrane protein [Flavobacteriaceae bacterium]MDA7711995.1 FeoB-associated Cys-rich membrane protein [Flavobacteriaceae bacterium]MDA8993325.1 FeoB-associated Cys-rich membrane protein [Flavobacteriaceae bacterium]
MELLQTFLVFSAGLLALVFLVKKFFFSTQKKSDKGCDTDCGCH